MVPDGQVHVSGEVRGVDKDAELGSSQLADIMRLSVAADGKAGPPNFT